MRRRIPRGVAYAGLIAWLLFGVAGGQANAVSDSTPTASMPRALASPAMAATSALTDRTSASDGQAGGDPCRTSAAGSGVIPPGPTTGPYYRTVAPYEHFGSARTQVFPDTCTVSEIAGPGNVEIASRASPVDFTTPYIAFTRDRDQLYLYGYGADAATEGGYVASIDPETLGERWRTRILAEGPPGQ